MKCILLAGGFATSMYPITKDIPKALLLVKNKPIISYIVEDVEKIDFIEEVIVVSNHLFYCQFEQWLETVDSRKKYYLFDTNQDSPDNEFSVVDCIRAVIDEFNINDNIFILATDNLLNFSLVEFFDYYKKINNSCVMYYEENDSAKLNRTGIISIDKDNKILKMVEKPTELFSNYAVPPFYIYKKELVEQIANLSLSMRSNKSVGFLLECLHKNNSIYAFRMPGTRIDLGNIDSYNYYKVRGV